MSLPVEQPAAERPSAGSTGEAAAGDAAAGAAATGLAAGRVPDFFIIGHEKCGTTALFKMLRRHPQIFMPEHKEPRFFSSDLRAAAPEKNRGKTHPRTLEDYLALFAPATPSQLAGEASPQYIRSPGAAKRIAELRPDARIIAILREPASFLYSVHSQYVHSGVETERDLRKAMALEQDRREGRHLPNSSTSASWVMYSEHVRYVEQLRRYHAVFPPEQVKILIYDDFRADNEQTIREVLRFLEVDESAPIGTVEANPTVRPRSQLLNELVHAVGVGRGPVSRTIKGGIKAVTPAAPRRAAFHAVKRKLVFAGPAPPDEELKRELRARFRGEVEAVSEYLGRDLIELWGYDSLG
jgi:hypothetical protein